ncbi:MAG: hypothetical protein AAGH68_16340 [Pseudomonadota bacterium]
MARIDLDAPVYALIWPVIRLNWPPLLSTSILVTAAEVAPDLVVLPEGVSTPQEFELAVIVVVMLAWVLAETSIAFAVFPTLLTAGLLHGYEALRRATFPRMATFVGVQFLMVLASVFLLATVLVIGPTLGMASAEAILDSPNLPLTTAISLLVMLLLGMTLPDIVMTGRVSLGRAMRTAVRNLRSLIIGLVIGAGLFWWGGEYTGALADAAAPDASSGEGVSSQFVALTYASVTLTILGIIAASIVLAKIYRRELPPAAVLEAGRVAEVFD